MTATLTPVGDLDAAQAAVRDAMDNANKLRQRVIDGDTDVTGSDLAEADSRIELARLRLAHIEKLRDEAAAREREKARKATEKDIAAAAKRREHITDLERQMREAADTYLAEALAYNADREALAAAAEDHGVNGVPDRVTPGRTILEQVGEVLAVHPDAARAGIAAEIRSGLAMQVRDR